MTDLTRTVRLFWIKLVGWLVHGWIYSYFWSAASIIYLILRRDVDGTEWYSVFLPEHASDTFAADPEPERGGARFPEQGRGRSRMRSLGQERRQIASEGKVKGIRTALGVGEFGSERQVHRMRVVRTFFPPVGRSGIGIGSMTSWPHSIASCILTFERIMMRSSLDRSASGLELGR